MRQNHYSMVARNAVKKTLEELSVLQKDSIGIGVSGGADSSALMLAVSKIYRNEKAKQVHVIIVDHQLQEVTATISANVAAYAEALGFTPHIVSVNVRETSLGMEAEARNVRYQAFEKIVEEFSLKTVLLGHTKSDQAEQVMLGLLRGSGTRSLAGIRKIRGVYARPFLDSLSREETQKVCEENGFVHWSDPQNDDIEYRRVAVRKILKAVKKDTGENLVNPLVKSASVASEDAEALDFYASHAFAQLETDDWSIALLQTFPKAVRKRAYRIKLLSTGVSSDQITFEKTNRIEDFVSDWSGQGAVAITASSEVVRRNAKIVFTRSAESELQ